ncbi:predicted protein [Chaetoceros tenuissimus]|uniref:Uncharacterized protein n=1 Tax=Chaetoceros tenuissimus TaxID=426638 RepID=A0AAD3CXT6_9STRA|nr:predicted protein [Chaetoceros tenuissimus]
MNVNMDMDMMNGGNRGKRSQQEVDAQEERPFKRYRAGADEQDENQQPSPSPSNQKRRHLELDHDAQMLEAPEEPGRTLKRRKTGPALPQLAQNINQYVLGFGTNDDRSGSVYQSPAFRSQVGRVRRSSRFAYDRSGVDPLSPQHMSSINEDNDIHRNSPIAPRRTGPPQRRDIAFPTEAERAHRRNELRAMNPNQSESSEDSSEDSFHDAVEEEVDQDSFHDARQSPSESPIEMPENENFQQGQVMEDETDEQQVTDDPQSEVMDEQEQAMEDETDEQQVTDDPQSEVMDEQEQAMEDESNEEEVTEDPQIGVMDEQEPTMEDESNQQQVTEDPQIGVVDEQEPTMEDESDEEDMTEDPQIAQEAEIDERGAFEWFQDEKGRRIRRSLRIKENERIHGRVVYTKYF